MVTVSLTAEMPDSELERFLILIRHWDGARDDIKARVTFSVPNMKVREIDEIIRRLDPKLPVVVKFDKVGGDAAN